jgi:selenocysteine lyase/cysteine desulfurase
MTISEILSNEELRQHEFPVCKRKIFLGHAGVCPLPRRVAGAMTDYLHKATTGDQEEFFDHKMQEEGRPLAARLLNAKPEEIAFVGPTSLGLSLVAGGLRLRKGDNVVIYQDDFPSNVHPWMPLADEGVEVRYLNTRGLGRLRNVDILGQVDERTRLVSVASCHFTSGWRVDLPVVGKALRSRGIWFCVDGIQTVGAFPTPVDHVDFLAADAHKWMLGPSSAGILYVRSTVAEHIRPRIFGWRNVRCPDFVAQEKLTYHSGGRRFEAGTLNLVGMVGMLAAIEMLLETGIDNIAAELIRKRAWLVPALQESGFSILDADAPPAHASGILSFSKEGTDMAALHQKLDAAGIVTSLRTDRAGRQRIRISPHFYNTDAELHRFLEQLA